jgi:hypothetical protein
LYPVQRSKILSLDQVKNYSHPQPEYVRPRDSRPHDNIATPKKNNEAEKLADRIEEHYSPTTGMRVAKLLKFGVQQCSANTLYQDRIQRVRDEERAEEVTRKAQRVSRLPNISYTREAVLEATYGTHEHWKVKIKHTYRGQRRARYIISFKYPQHHEFINSLYIAASSRRKSAME